MYALIYADLILYSDGYVFLILHQGVMESFYSMCNFATERIHNGKRSGLMGILDGLMSNVEAMAEKLGVSTDKAGALMSSLQEKLTGDGDKMQAIQDLAAEHGVSVDKIKEMLGGEDSLLGKATGFLDKDGDGNPLNDLAGMAKGFFGKKD